MKRAIIAGFAIIFGALMTFCVSASSYTEGSLNGSECTGYTTVTNPVANVYQVSATTMCSDTALVKVQISAYFGNGAHKTSSQQTYGTSITSTVGQPSSVSGYYNTHTVTIGNVTWVGNTD